MNILNFIKKTVIIATIALLSGCASMDVTYMGPPTQLKVSQKTVQILGNGKIDDALSNYFMSKGWQVHTSKSDYSNASFAVDYNLLWIDWVPAMGSMYKGYIKMSNTKTGEDVAGIKFNYCCKSTIMESFENELSRQLKITP